MEKGFVTIIEELGLLLSNYKEEINFKDDEIKNLKKKIEEIESYHAFYNNEITEDEYNEIMKRS